MQLYALVADATMTLDDERKDVIRVEAGKKGDRRAFEFAQAYSVKKGKKKPTKDGRPLLVGTCKRL